MLAHAYGWYTEPGLGEDLLHPQRELRRGSRRDRLLLAEDRDRVVIVSMGRTAHDDTPFRDFDDPIFLNAGARVEAILCRAVKSEGRVGDLDQQRDVFGTGVASKELRIVL